MNPDKLLNQACKIGDMPSIEWLLEYGVWVASRDREWSVKLESGLKVVDNKKEKSLFIRYAELVRSAGLGDHTDVVKYLLSINISKLVNEDDLRTILVECIYEKKFATAKYILSSWEFDEPHDDILAPIVQTSCNQLLEFIEVQDGMMTPHLPTVVKKNNTFLFDKYNTTFHENAFLTACELGRESFVLKMVPHIPKHAFQIGFERACLFGQYIIAELLVSQCTLDPEVFVSAVRNHDQSIVNVFLDNGFVVTEEIKKIVSSYSVIL